MSEPSEISNKQAREIHLNGSEQSQDGPFPCRVCSEPKPYAYNVCGDCVTRIMYAPIEDCRCIVWAKEGVQHPRGHKESGCAFSEQSEYRRGVLDAANIVDNIQLRVPSQVLGAYINNLCDQLSASVRALLTTEQGVREPHAEQWALTLASVISNARPTSTEEGNDSHYVISRELFEKLSSVHREMAQMLWGVSEREEGGNDIQWMLDKLKSPHMKGYESKSASKGWNGGWNAAVNYLIAAVNERVANRSAVAPAPVEKEGVK